MASDHIAVPSQLAVLPLPYPFVLHPSLLLSIPLSYAHALSLLKAALQTTASEEGAVRRPDGRIDNSSSRPIVVACLPSLVAPQGSAAKPTPPSLQKSVVPFNGGNKGTASSTPGTAGTVRLGDLAEWGCAARLLRLTRHPASQTCTLLVTGLARIRVDRFLSSRVNVTLAGPSNQIVATSRKSGEADNNLSSSAPSQHDVSVPLAAVTSFVDGVALSAGAARLKPLGAEQGDQELIRNLRVSANDLLDALAALAVFSPSNSAGGNKDSSSNSILPVTSVSPAGNGVIGSLTAGTAGSMPLLPPAMLKRLRALVKDTPDVAAATLADVLVGTLGGACEWAARLDLLSEWDARGRVRAATVALRNAAGRVLLAKELISSLAAPLNASSKETLIRMQLESLLTSLAAINPNVSARIVTPNGGFSINSGAMKDSDRRGSGGNANGNNNQSGVITIRSNASNSDAARIINSIRNGGNPFRIGNREGGSGSPFSGLGGGGSDGPSGGNGGGGVGIPGAGGNDDSAEADEVQELAAKLDRAQLTPDARKVCEKELKRLSRIPQQSVERGVVITYLELMAELPWDKTSGDLTPEEMEKHLKRGAHVDAAKDAQREEQGEGIVERARRILDEDHYGLDKIKKRLVEYLAVLELKTIQAEEKMQEEEAKEIKQRRENEAKNNTGEGGKSDSEQADSLADATDAVADFIRIDDGADRSGDDRSKDYERGQGFRHIEDLAEEEKNKHDAKQMMPRKRPSVADKGPILLLVGPPGTGKTSIAKSLATALRRPFTRLSLGGVRDEAEIRGHRRTYVGAMPGSIASALRKVGVSDPVILLDEVDKLGSGNGLHGDPMAAMLEVLDPEQNSSFNDHYVNCSIDLSKVLFIATANSLDTISPPLLDRTEVIQVSGYTHDEKVAIARQYLLPKQIKAQGLKPEDLSVSDEVLLKVAMSYTREAGVRTLERQIGAIARGKAVEYAEVKKGAKNNDGSLKVYDPVVHVDQLEKLLGVETYDPEVAELQSRPGVATGLAYQGSGAGGILHIESVLLPPGNGHLKLTGSLGDVIRESAELALSWVKAHAFQLGITSSRDSEFPKNDIHLHLPSGAIPKDGPSAGVAMTCALVSLFTRTTISPKLAMTGEITLRGQVTPVGGIKEKCLGAHRAGITKVLLPHRNRKDIEADLPPNVKAELEVVYIKTIWQALEVAFGIALFDHSSGNREGIEEGRKMMFEMEQSRL